MVSDARAVAVLGDGGWGTTLAILCADLGRAVSLWGPFPDYIRQMRESRENPKFLPGVRVPPTIRLTAELAEAIADASVVLLAVPSLYLRQTVERLKPLAWGNRLLVSVAKGIERGTLLRMSEIIRQLLGPVPLAVLSGPTIAREVALHIPTACVAAAEQPAWAQQVQETLSAQSGAVPA